MASGTCKRARPWGHQPNSARIAAAVTFAIVALSVTGALSFPLRRASSTSSSTSSNVKPVRDTTRSRTGVGSRRDRSTTTTAPLRAQSPSQRSRAPTTATASGRCRDHVGESCVISSPNRRRTREVAEDIKDFRWDSGLRCTTAADDFLNGSSGCGSGFGGSRATYHAETCFAEDEHGGAAVAAPPPPPPPPRPRKQRAGQNREEQMLRPDKETLSAKVSSDEISSLLSERGATSTTERVGNEGDFAKLSPSDDESYRDTTMNITDGHGTSTTKVPCPTPTRHPRPADRDNREPHDDGHSQPNHHRWRQVPKYQRWRGVPAAEAEYEAVASCKASTAGGQISGAEGKYGTSNMNGSSVGNGGSVRKYGVRLRDNDARMFLLERGLSQAELRKVLPVVRTDRELMSDVGVLAARMQV